MTQIGLHAPIVENILLFLPPEEIVHARQVCKQWRRIIDASQILQTALTPLREKKRADALEAMRHRIIDLTEEYNRLARGYNNNLVPPREPIGEIAIELEERPRDVLEAEVEFLQREIAVTRRRTRTQCCRTLVIGTALTVGGTYLTYFLLDHFA